MNNQTINTNKAQALFKKAYFFNWDNGLKSLEKMINDPNCDLATASMIFWHGQPDYYYNKPENETFESYETKAFDFLKSLADKILANKFPVLISYTPEEGFLPKELGKIPPQLAQPINGTIDFNKVLYPNQNPFNEQIMELCRNCKDVQEMYELEKLGADFSLKINNGYSDPIAFAVGNLEAFKYFIEKKYDINKKYHKQPLFHNAVYQKNSPFLKMMVENGCKVNQKGEFGRTIFHKIGGSFTNKTDNPYYQFDAEIIEVLDYLIDVANGDLTILDSDKKSPLDLAIYWKNDAYIEYINKKLSQNPKTISKTKTKK